MSQISAKEQNKAFLTVYAQRIKDIEAKGQTPPIAIDEDGFMIWLTRKERRHLAKKRRKAKHG